MVERESRRGEEVSGVDAAEAGTKTHGLPAGTVGKEEKGSETETKSASRNGRNSHGIVHVDSGQAELKERDEVASSRIENLA